MTNVTVYVGLDYHQDAVQVCVLDAAGGVLSNRPCRNDVVALRERVAAFGDHRLIRYDVRWSQLGRKLKAVGKPGSVAAAAVANRWVRWRHHEMTTAA